MYCAPAYIGGLPWDLLQEDRGIQIHGAAVTVRGGDAGQGKRGRGYAAHGVAWPSLDRPVAAGPYCSQNKRGQSCFHIASKASLRGSRLFDAVGNVVKCQ